ncbi:MAG: hypothetical protein ACTHNN_07950 [Xanthobacteraceae bacterium]
MTTLACAAGIDVGRDYLDVAVAPVLALWLLDCFARNDGEGGMTKKSAWRRE